MLASAVETLTYPISGPGRERPLVATWALVLAGFLLPLLPWILAVGYLVRVLDASDRGDPAPRFFADARAYLRDALGGTALTVLFLAGPFLALLITVYGARFGVEGVEPGNTPTLLIYAGSTVVLAVALLGSYLLPVALFRFGRTGSLRSALSGRWLRLAGLHGAYFAGWTLGAVLGLTGVGLAVRLFSVGRIGPPIAALVLAHAGIVTAYVWGRALSRVH